MCVVSAVMDTWIDRWNNPPYTTPPQPIPPVMIPVTVPMPMPTVTQPKQPTPEEWELFWKMMDMAREYDKRTNQPDCESEDKKRILRDIAEKFGVKISFPDEKVDANAVE